MNFKPRHGTVMPVTLKEINKLIGRFMTPDAVLQTAKGEGLVESELVIDTLERRLYLPLAPGTNANLFTPAFVHFPGISIVPRKKVDFSKGAVPYLITIIGHKPETYMLSITESKTTKSSE